MRGAHLRTKRIQKAPEAHLPSGILLLCNKHSDPLGQFHIGFFFFSCSQKNPSNLMMLFLCSLKCPQ